MFDLDRVGRGLLQERLRLWYEFPLVMLLSEGQRVGCQDHGIVMLTPLTPDPGQRQPGIDSFGSMFDDML